MPMWIGTGLLKKKFPSALSAISLASTANADVKLSENDTLNFGDRKLYALHTPGHTEVRDNMFTMIVSSYFISQ